MMVINGGHATVWGAIGGAFLALPGWGQILAVVAAIGGAGAAAYASTDEYRELPARVASIEEEQSLQLMAVGHEISLLSLRVHDNTDAIDDLSKRVDRMICLQEAAAGQHGYEQCVR
jgi:hypothetical protein